MRSSEEKLVSIIENYNSSELFMEFISKVKLTNPELVEEFISNVFDDIQEELDLATEEERNQLIYWKGVF